jgi:hypothetical protein
MTTTFSMKPLYARLMNAGLDSAFVKKYVLPEWWDDSIAHEQAGYMQALSIISRNLGIDFSSLERSNGAVLPQAEKSVKFKKSMGTYIAELAWAKAIALRTAEIVTRAATVEFSEGTHSVEQLREQILSEGNPYVALDTLLDYLWASGVPVIHVSSFPRGRKMDGMAVRIGDRPVIVISKNKKCSAWLLFILAHELGHVANGHLKSNEAIVDEKIEDTDSEEASAFQDEVEANQYAVALLTGNPNTAFTASSWLTTEMLAKSALSLSETNRIHPGVIALNYAKGKNFFPTAQAALALVDPDQNAVNTIRRKMLAYLDLDLLPEDSREFFARTSGIELNLVEAAD